MRWCAVVLWSHTMDCDAGRAGCRLTLSRSGVFPSPWCGRPCRSFDRGTRGSRTRPCSLAAASGRLATQQVDPTVSMVRSGDVFRALTSSEHHVKPVSAVLHFFPPTQRRRGGVAWGRRDGPQGRAGAAPGPSYPTASGCNGYTMSSNWLGLMMGASTLSWRCSRHRGGRREMTKSHR